MCGSDVFRHAAEPPSEHTHQSPLSILRQSRRRTKLVAIGRLEAFEDFGEHAKPPRADLPGWELSTRCGTTPATLLCSPGNPAVSLKAISGLACPERRVRVPGAHAARCARSLSFRVSDGVVSSLDMTRDTECRAVSRLRALPFP